MSEFKDKVVVVTGGANGIGKCITEEFRKEGALVNISSSRDRMSQAQTESYTAAKGGISALTHAQRLFDLWKYYITIIPRSDRKLKLHTP